MICGLKGATHTASAKFMIISNNWTKMFALFQTFLLILHNLERKKWH